DRGLLAHWLYGVAYRVARRARSRTLRRRGRETPIAGLEVSVGSEISDYTELDPALDRELCALPEKFRAPLILCYLRGRTHEEAAADLHCPVGTVRSRLARGRDLLKKRLMLKGYIPTTLFLGPSSALSARLLTETVPPALVSATVRSALGLGPVPAIPAGAG